MVSQTRREYANAGGESSLSEEESLCNFLQIITSLISVCGRLAESTNTGRERLIRTRLIRSST